MSTTALEEPVHVHFTVVEEGTVRKSHKLVSSDGFAYIIKRSTQKAVQWRCNQRRTGQICYASVRQEGDVFSRGTMAHNHPANPLVRQTVELSRDLKRAAVRDVHGPTNSYVEGQLKKQFTDRVQNGRVIQNGQIPKPTSLARTMNRARQQIRPKESETLDFEVNTDFLQDEFLVGDVWVDDKRHLMFATNEQLQLLQTARKWYLDGTFKVVKKPFTQLWSIHAFIREGESTKQVPLMFVLMSRRRKLDYAAVLGKLLDILPETPAVECFCMDYEIGLWQALRQVFPGTVLQGCAFHWSQSVIKHVRDFGLIKTYRERPTVRQLISKLLALPFLPGRAIERAFNRLKDRASTSSEDVRDLFDYVEDTWVNTTLWSTAEWSVYRQPVRTNNDTEGWHRKLNQKAGKGSLAFYVLVPLLLDEAKTVTIAYQLVSQESLIRNRRAVYVSMDEQIGELWDKYDNHDIVCEEFLAGVGEIYGRV